MMKKTAANYLNLLSWRRPWIWLLGILLTYHLALAIITPLLIKNRLNDLVVNQLKLNLDIDGISINPYQFSVEISKVKISGQELDQPLGFDHLFIDLQLWDSLNGIWTINQFQLTGIYGEFKRIDNSTHNFTRIIEHWAGNTQDDPNQNATNDDAGTSLPKLYIENAYVQFAQFGIVDKARKKAFQTDIGPIDFHIQKLSSLPGTIGQQSLLLKTKQGVELSWKGDISLMPFNSKGDVTLSGPFLTTLAEYLNEELKVSVTNSDFRSNFHYAIHPAEKSGIAIHISSIETQANNINIHQLVNNAELLSLKELTLKGGEFKWPESSIHIPNIELNHGDVWIKNSHNDQLNWMQIVEEDTDSNTQKSLWQLTNDHLSIKGINLHYTDNSTPDSPSIEISATTSTSVDVDNIALNIKNLSNKENQKIEIATAFGLQGGKFESAATLQINPLQNAEGSYQIAQFPVTTAQGFIDDYALVNITGGTLSAEGKITSKDEVIEIQGDALIDQFKLQEKSSGKTILTWSKLRINRITANTNEKKINIGRMRFNEAFADFNIFADGSHTLSRILIQPEPSAESINSDDSSASTPFSYLVGRIDFDKASGKFSDASLPLPFSADISNINGTISTLDSTSHTPANLKLEGQVSDFGEMVMSGAIFPLEPTQKTQMQLAFNNIDIADLSPYSIKFAGREIAKGKMDLDLDYEINKSRMQGKNNIVLHDFALGKKIDHPGAADLPLDLAIALLKDKDGTIRADLPVEGNVDDPKFDYGKTIRRAIRKLITNVAAAPFRFLAGLVGVGNNKDLGYISFFAGRTDLSPAQTEKVKQLGEAMIKRPNLQITIAGVYSAAFDTNALKEEKFNAKLREHVSQNLTDANIGSRKYIATLEKLYEDKGLSPKLDDLKNNSSTTVSEDNSNIDRLTYVKAIKDALVEQEVVSQEDLIQLANHRAQIVYTQLSQTPGLNIARLKMTNAREGQLNKDNKLKLELDASLKKTKAKKNKPIALQIAPTTGNALQ